VIFTV